MKRYFLILFIFPTIGIPSYSQQKMTNQEILEVFRTIQKKPNVDSIFRWEGIHQPTRYTFDRLVNRKIDTLLVYTKSYPGAVGIPDSCSTVYPIESYFFWSENDCYYGTKVDGLCETNDLKINGSIIQFIIKNISIIEHEFFMDVIYGVTKNGDKITISGGIKLHEPTYLILILLDKELKSLSFSESDINDEKSLFHNYNKSLISFELFNLLEKRVSQR